MAKKYVPAGVILTCDKGTLPMPLNVLPHGRATINGMNLATSLDCAPGINVPPLGVCTMTKLPCVLIPVPGVGWSPVKDDVQLGMGHPLLEDSKLRCMATGCISIHFSMAAAQAACAPPPAPEKSLADQADDYLKTLGSPLGDYGRFQLGVAEGLWAGGKGLAEGLWGMAKGGWNAVTHPVDTIQAVQEGAANAYKWAGDSQNWSDAASSAGQGISNAATWASNGDNWSAVGDKLENMSPRDWGNVTGQIAFEVGVGVATAGAGTALNAAAKTSRLARMAVRVGRIADVEGHALSLAGRAARSAAGRLKILGKVITGARRSTRMAARARRARTALKRSRVGQQLGALRDFIGKDRCWWRGHPVDVATGLMSTDGVDFELPGPIPLRWERTWYSRSTHTGPLGHGWHHAYDLALTVDATHVGLRRADGRLALFARPVPGGSSYLRAERLELFGDEALGFRVWDLAEQLWYVFDQPARDAIYALSAVEDGRGHALRFAYSAVGHLQGITDSVGRVLRVDTDAAGRLLALHAPDPDQPGATFALVRYAYSEAEDLVRVTDALGQALHFAYTDHLLTQETFRSGLSFYFEYDGADSSARCTRTWGEGGLIDTKFRYDSPTQTTVWDSYGKAAVYTHHDGLVRHAVDEVGATQSWSYNASLELEQHIDPLGQATSYDYDGRGNRTQTKYPDGTQVQTQYNAVDAPVEVIDANGGVWRWAYDVQGQLTSRTDPMGVAMDYTYDAAGRLATVTNALGQVTRLRYDAQGQLIHLVAPNDSIRSRSYDTLGRLVSLTDARGHVERRHYDRLGRLVGVQPATREAQRFAYDTEGHVVRAEAGQQVLEYVYSPLGQLAQQRQGGQAVAFAYDLEGRLIALTNERGEAYTFGLDAVGQVVEEVGFDGLTRRYTRDAAGRVTHLARPAGRTTTYTYDAAGRVAELVHNGDERVTYAYRADGALLEAVTDMTTVTFERDALGRVLAEMQNGHKVESAYDVMGQRMGLCSSLGAAVSFERDTLGQVHRTQSGAWQSVIGRDAEGLELHRQLSGGLRLDWQHDAAGRPTSQRISAGGRAERRRRYQWRGADQLTEIDDSQQGSTRYRYDALGALTGTVYADGEQELRAPDAVGNLFRTAERMDRHYGAGGQLQQANGTRYKYDAEGNLIRKTQVNGQQWHYAWDGAGQLIEVKRPDGYSVTFCYDAFGRRISKRFRGKRTRWVWDGDKPLHEWSELEVGPGAGGVAELSTWLFEDDSFAPVAKLTADGRAQSVVSDHLGTPLELYDGQGVKTWQAQLDSYGAVRQGQGRPQDCPFRYQGQYEDVETGLYYNRFRYYDPEAGQYISQDPIRLEGGVLNLYGYVANPGTWVDPLGLAGICKLFEKKLGITQRWVDRLTGKSATEVEGDLVRRGWTRSSPQANNPTAIQHTAFTRTTKAGDTYILDYHPGSTPTQANLHSTPYWKVYKEVGGERQVFGRIAPDGFQNYDLIHDSPVFVNGVLVN